MIKPKRMRRYPRREKKARPAGRQGRIRWPKVLLSVLLREAGIFMLSEDIIIPRKELMRFYVSSRVALRIKE